MRKTLVLAAIAATVALPSLASAQFYLPQAPVAVLQPVNAPVKPAYTGRRSDREFYSVYDGATATTRQAPAPSHIMGSPF